MYTKEIENTYAISLTEDFLLDLENILEESFETVYCVATLKNKNRKSFETIKELCEYENALEKRILKLEISAYSDKNESIHLFFEEKEKTSVRGIISTSDNITTDSIYEKIDYAIRRKSEGLVFSWIARIEYLWMAIMMLLVLAIISDVISSGNTTSNSDIINKYSFQYFITIIELAAIYMCIVAVIFKIKKYFFPIIVFCIGDEIKKYEKRNSLKKNIIWAVIVAIAASIIGSFIYAKLTGK